MMIVIMIMTMFTQGNIFNTQSAVINEDPVHLGLATSPEKWAGGLMTEEGHSATVPNLNLIKLSDLMGVVQLLCLKEREFTCTKN